MFGGSWFLRADWKESGLNSSGCKVGETRAGIFLKIWGLFKQYMNECQPQKKSKSGSFRYGFAAGRAEGGRPAFQGMLKIIPLTQNQDTCLTCSNIKNKASFYMFYRRINTWKDSSKTWITRLTPPPRSPSGSLALVPGKWGRNLWSREAHMLSAYTRTLP